MYTRVRETLSDNADLVTTLVVALLAGCAGVAGSYAAARFTPAFIAGPIAGALARWMPGAVVTVAIVVLGDIGDQLVVLSALGLAVCLLAAASWVGLAVDRRVDAPLVGAVAGGVVAASLTVAVTGAPESAAASGLGVGVVLAVATLVPGETTADHSPERRRVLAGAVSALAVVLGGYVFGTRTAARDRSQESTLRASPAVRGEINALLAEAAEKSLGIDGLEPLVSDTFYEVDINATNPNVDAETWELTITGAVENEITYTYDDITSMDAENRFVSLQCVGDSLNGEKLDNALWTGVPISDLLAPAEPAEGCCVMFRAVDGFYEEFPMAALESGFLAYGMNGKVLPRGHGYPARVLIPGHWGEINVKWLTEIELLESKQEGYWEKRGWHGTGPVNTVAKLYLANDLPDGRIQLGGHAYAGTRGVEKVEVSTDGGEAWHAAQLSEPLPGDDVWRQWTYDYESPGRTHQIVVRATDGTGALQSREDRSPYPNGPSGWVTLTHQG